MFEQLPNTQRKGSSFPTHTHTQNIKKWTIKIKNPENNIEKTSKKKQINKILKTIEN